MNYFKYSETLLNETYIYIDTFPYTSDQIFLDNNLEVEPEKALSNKNNNYRIVFAKIKKNKEELFIKCMDELCKKIIIKGYYDYVSVCNSIIGKMNEEQEKQKVAKKV